MSPCRSLLSVALVALSLAVSVPAANAGNEALVGKWACLAQTPDGDLPSSWTITEKAGAIAVDVEIGRVTSPAQDVKVAGRSLTMKVTYQSATYDVSATFDGDALTGTWAGDGRQGAIKGKRS
ncbi:MAG TPA: hypothetical protein VMV21_07510 [Vicinamibacteria bacterium]|nr:hypothetical protein [Vicinamibacteria bacterium]